MEYSNLFVVVFGLGTVFFGLICIILLIHIITLLFGERVKDETVVLKQEVTLERPEDITAVILAVIAMEENLDFGDVKEVNYRRCEEGK